MAKLRIFASLMGVIALAAAARADDILKLENETQRYRLVLQIGSAETMYTAAEAKAKHPTSGEIMLSGKMAGMPAMDHTVPGMMPVPQARHVELHIYARDTGKPVAEARVSITLTGADKKRHAVPMARMYGVAEGLEDVHFGNNMAISAGSYTVDATVNGEPAHFAVTVPPGS
jgi:hypothetical protein